MSGPEKGGAGAGLLELETIAVVLTEADREKDHVVARRWGIRVAVLREWRYRAVREPQLGKLVRSTRNAALEEWRPEAARTLCALFEELRGVLKDGSDPSFQLIAAIKTVGALNLEAGALLGEGELDGGADA